MKDNYASTNEAIQQMEAAAVNFGYRFINDAMVRAEYISRTKEMARELRAACATGSLSYRQAAEAANEMRNEIMEFARVKSSDIGRAKAAALKAKGLDLDEVLQKYAQSKFQKAFRELTSEEANRVYLEVVDAAGRPNPRVSAKTARLGGVGKGLWVLTACVAIYNVSVSNNKPKTIGREAANIGGGFGGGAAAGAVAGIWFGPVGIAIGVIIGGVLGSIVSDQVYIEIVGADGKFAKDFIAKYTNLVSTDEDAIAEALVRDCSYEMHKVLEVLYELNDKYSTDADDIALLYVNKIREMPDNLIKTAFRQSGELRKYLKETLESGWTSAEEQRAIKYLESLGNL